MQGKYKTFEGTEIVAENCVKAKVKDLVVEGKTYQNLVTNLDELAGNVYTTSKYASIPTKMFKTNTTYTVITTINESVYSSTKFGALLVIKYTTIGDSYIPISLVDGTFKIKFTTGAENPTNIRLQVHGANDTTSSFKLDNLIILEGDYITKELPDSINGIESVAERENNILSVKINDNTTTLNLPIPLRSLPNGVADTIEGNKLVQRVGKVVLDGSETYSLWGNGLLDNTIGITTSNSSLNIVRADRVFYCDKLPVVGNLSVANDFEGITSSSNTYKMWTIKLSLNKLTEATLDKAVNYIKNNNITIYYPLATPIIHDLEIPNISTVRGANIITTSNNIKPNVRIKIKTK